MKISSFLTEHFYAQYEFTTPYQLCNSDCETLTVEELLKMANVPAYSGEIAHPFRKHAAHFREKILVEIIVH